MFFPGEDPLLPPPHDDSTLATVFLVLSHVGLLPLAIFFLYDGLAYLAGNALSVFVFSDVYHICRGGWHCFGLTPATSRLLDHIVADHAVAGLFLTAIGYHRGGGAAAFARAVMPFIVAFADLAYPYHPQSKIIILTVLVLIVLDRFLREGRMRVPDPSRFGRIPAALGAAAAVTGLVLFYVCPPDTYPATHSIWHILLTVAFFFFGIAVTRGETRLRFSFCRSTSASGRPL